MKHLPALLLMLFIHQQLFSQKTDLSPAKKNAIESVDKHQAELTALSDSVWSYAETALKEYQSSKILSDYAENQGFKVTRNVAGLQTAFIAEYGSGKPIIGVLGEFDALQGLSQKAEAEKGHQSRHVQGWRVGRREVSDHQGRGIRRHRAEPSRCGADR